ncbi:hypothetical protein [uncultured Halopseudomonas sp.]|uniref:TubC N-terminal docking domain-related protein n=1 Tax=uncultured Halopseudomonas sp. TaxID=2901193 RepID=UPI0030EDF09B|tara:strand:+ start:7539 stop:8120 length:582 start_codon:yes stop_codon:yes gene_type:complete
MNAAVLIEQANTAGIILALNGESLAWSARKQPSPELLIQLREGKAQIIEHLRQQQHGWLDRVAALLNTNAGTLLEHGLIDLDDLAEQYQKHPRFAALLIETSPAWQKVNLVRDEVRAPYAREVRTECVPTKVNKGNTPKRENSTNKRRAPEWIAGRDAFHNHAVGNCNKCYPPAARYCPTGLDLLALYQMAMQ